MDKNKLLNIYEVMEEQLKDDARSIKFIKNLGRQLIEKMKIIDEEIHRLNPNRINTKLLPNSDGDLLVGLYQLRSEYRSQFNMIKVVLNKSDDLIDIYNVKRYKTKGLDDKFFIKI